MDWQPVLAIVGPALTMAGSGVAWYFLRKDKNQETRENRALSFEERRENDLAKERERVTNERDAAMADLRMEIDRCHAEINGYRTLIKEKNVERFLAWDRARAWHQKCWDMRNEAAYARQLVDSLLRTSGQPAHPWQNDLMMPLFDNIIIVASSSDEK